MKVIIAGSKNANDYQEIKNAITNSGFEVTEIVSGGCRGVDTLAIQWAKRNKKPFKVFPANWAEWGRKAGPVRNKEMAKYADALIALPGGKGTESMITEAKKKRLQIYVHTPYVII